MARRDLGPIRAERALAGLRALMLWGEMALGKAIARAPIEEGTLRASGSLGFRINGQLLEGRGAYPQARSLVAQLAAAGRLFTIEVVLTFNEVYAARQHEETEWQHPLGGQAKYLESVLQEEGSRAVRAAQLAMARATE